MSPGGTFPLARLEELGAEVLLLGVGFDRCSCFHLAEYRQTVPRQRTYSCVVTEAGLREPFDNSDRRWFHYEDVDLDERDFAQIGADFEDYSSKVSRGLVGAAEARLFPLKPAVAFAVEWMELQRPSAGMTS